MNPDNELADLVREWKEIDMRTLELTVDTAEKRGRAQGSVWAMIGMNVAIFGLLALLLVRGDPTSDPLILGSVVMLGVSAVYFVPFTVQYLSRLRRVDALLRGPPAAIVRARREMKLSELQKWGGDPLSWSLVVSNGVTAVMLGWMAWSGFIPAWGGVVLIAGLVAPTVYGRWFRVPGLKQEIAELDRLLHELEDGA